MRHPELPAKLYKYQPFTAIALANLKKRVWYFAPPAVFNDPFECRHDLRAEKPSLADIEVLRESFQRDVAAGDTAFEFLLALEQRELAEAVDEMYAERSPQLFRNFEGRGVCCFAGRLDSLLMWGHYADGHRGFCLEFDTSSSEFDRFKKVEYFEESPSLSVSKVVAGDTAGAFAAILCSKPTEWAYEQEWRMFHASSAKEYGYGTECLSAVYLGARMLPVHADLVGLVLHGSKTKLYQAKIARGSYKLTFDPVDYKPHPEAGGGGA